MASSLCILFVTGLDRRRFSPHVSPHLCRLLDDYPSVSIRNIPSNELPSTIYTGTYPREHGMWQMTLKKDVPDTLIVEHHIRAPAAAAVRPLAAAATKSN